MLSILIPTYNYSVLKLVNELTLQCDGEKFIYEIIVIDDCSTINVNENKDINTISGCSYLKLQKNIGRSCIRNLLAKKEHYKWLLSLNSDVLPISKSFINDYLSSITEGIKVINGDIVYQKEKPKTDKVFR